LWEKLYRNRERVRGQRENKTVNTRRLQYLVIANSIKYLNLTVECVEEGV
jgi:hypothetical protein